MIVLIILLFLSLILNVFLSFICLRFSKRLLEFDSLFAMLMDDIDVNVRYFRKLLSTPLLENSPEIRAANKNMGIISQRLDEFAKRIGETRGEDNDDEQRGE